MGLVPNEWLVSRNARDRYLRWREDLRRAEGKAPPASPASSSYDRAANNDHHPEASGTPQRDHTKAILTSTWNEGQPDSPAPASNSRLSVHIPYQNWLFSSYVPMTLQHRPRSSGKRYLLNSLEPSPSSSKNASASPLSPTPKRQRFASPNASESGTPSSNKGTGASLHDGASSYVLRDPLASRYNEGPFATSAIPHLERPPPSLATESPKKDGDKTDKITDTVGAIAIDQSGRIAAGSSSGGIGMKHRGRIGPAALVGIGTAVIPANEDDSEGIAVAAVTSGTGEHMATTIASQKCAERIFHGTRRGPTGKDVAEDDEKIILKHFIENDFQGHPGVKNSTSAGAIGVMAVKKAPKGYYLYFAHNTDSFALASMSSNDSAPSVVMSRVSEGGSGIAESIAQGARKIHLL